MDNIILEQIIVEKNLLRYKFSVSGSLNKFFNDNELWIQYDEDLSEVPNSVLSIPFVSIMMPVVWVTDSVLWINELDKTFYHSIYNIQRAYQNLYRKYPLRGRIVPSYMIPNVLEESNDSFILFSGGVDAHTSYIRNKECISRLINIQGFYKFRQDENIAAYADFRDIAAFAKQQGKEFSFLKSNFAQLVNLDSYASYAKAIGDSLWHGFQHSMAFISFTIPLAFKHKCSKILIASSFTVGDSRVCASYPTTDNEFTFAENGIIIHDGFELSRQEKTKVITDYQRMLNKPYPIRVCSFNDHNCCECEKCFRTILGIVAEGSEVKDFGFNLDGTLKNHWNEVIYRRGGLMGFKNERISHWPHIIKRMKANYDKMTQEQKEFVDWFLTFDFDKAQKKSRRQYYRQNFFSILKRKLHL